MTTSLAPNELTPTEKPAGPQQVQRLRLIFSQQGVLRYVGHLDLVRTWERALRRASVPLAYSEGFNPQPRVFFAAALPLGATGQREVVDVVLTEAIAPDAFVARVAPHLPSGLTLIDASEAPIKTPALQSLLRTSAWQVEVQTDDSPQALVERINDFMAKETFSSTRKRKGQAVTYDLRALILAIHYEGQSELGWHRLTMVLRSEPNATGRPDAVLTALGLGDKLARIDRLGCTFAESA